jgi:type IV pilus assembly protein PilM
MKVSFKDLLLPVINRIPRTNRAFSLGLELGLNRVNLVQMERTGNHTGIRAMASIAHPFSFEELQKDPHKLKASLKQAYAMQPFKGKRVVSCLPADQIKIITVAFRPIEGEKDTIPVVTELRERLKGELDDLVVDFMTLRQDEANSDKRDALVALAPRDKVVAHLDLLARSGLEVDALDIGPAALTRLVSHAGAIHAPGFPNLPNVLLVNFGADSSYLTVIWGRRLMLDRAVDFSENRLFSRLKQVLDMPQELALRLLYEHAATPESNVGVPGEARKMVGEVLRPEINALLQEINKTLVYMASRTRGKSVDKIYLAGRVCNYPGIVTNLGAQLHVPVEKLDPVAVFGAQNTRFASDLGTMAGMALTTGLALRGVREHE